MLTLISTILCVVCYCCHRNIKKRTEAAYRQQRQWLENDPNMEIYSVEQVSTHTHTHIYIYNNTSKTTRVIMQLRHIYACKKKATKIQYKRLLSVIKQ